MSESRTVLRVGCCPPVPTLHLFRLHLTVDCLGYLVSHYQSNSSACHTTVSRVASWNEPPLVEARLNNSFYLFTVTLSRHYLLHTPLSCVHFSSSFFLSRRISQLNFPSLTFKLHGAPFGRLPTAMSLQTVHWLRSLQLPHFETVLQSKCC